MPFIANFVCSKQHNYMVKIGTTLSPLGKKAVLCGSGELGKEVAIELQRYGIEVVALDRYANAPAMQVAHRSYVLSMLDGAQLRAVIEKEKPDYIIPEIEAIATDMLLELEKEGYNVIPTARATRLTMNREGIRRLAAEELGIYYNTGEGGLHRDFYKYGANTIVQVASGRFGIEERCLNAGAAIEIKMGQGAKPGIGGHLPGAKIVGDVSKTRMIPEGSDAISPAPHHDIYSIEDLRQLVYSLKEATQYKKPVIVKVAAVHNIAAIASGIARSGADIIAIDGYRGGTGAAPTRIRDNVGIPIELALAAVDQRLRDEGIRSSVSLIAGGSIRSSADVVKAIALGADACYIGTAALLALGCHLCRSCHTGRCNWGIATQNPDLVKRLDPDVGAERLVNLVTAWKREIKEMMGGMGINSIEALRGNRVMLRGIGLTEKELEILGVAHAGE